MSRAMFSLSVSRRIGAAVTLTQKEFDLSVYLFQNPDVLQKIRLEIFKKAGLDFITKELKWAA